VPRESTLEFVAGSHASRTWYMPRSFFDDRTLVFDDGTFEEVPDVESERDVHTILGWALQPGDAVAFNMLTLHAAAGSRNRRRAFSVRLVGGDVRLAVRPHPTSPPFPELDDVLGHGEPLDHPLFPRVWPRDAVA
jgi:ectoine hydroxylase-related dioxygenase (phytanoyl-CoA dioxygenase family)